MSLLSTIITILLLFLYFDQWTTAITLLKTCKDYLAAENFAQTPINLPLDSDLQVLLL